MERSINFNRFEAELAGMADDVGRLRALGDEAQKLGAMIRAPSMLPAKCFPRRPKETFYYFHEEWE